MIILYIILTANICLLISILFFIQMWGKKGALIENKLTEEDNKSRIDTYDMQKRISKFEKIMAMLITKGVDGMLIDTEYAIKISKNTIFQNKWETGIQLKGKSRNISDIVSDIITDFELEPVFEEFLKNFNTKCIEFWYGEEYNSKLKNLEKTIYIITKSGGNKTRQMNALEYNINTKKSLEKVYTIVDIHEIYKSGFNLIPPKQAKFVFNYFNNYMYTIGIKKDNGIVKVNNNTIGVYLYINLPVKKSFKLVKFCKKNFNVDLNEIFSSIKDYTFHVVGISKCRQIDDCKNTWKLALYYHKKIYREKTIY